MAVGVVDTKVRFKLGARNLTLDYRKVPFLKWAELKRATTFTQRTLMTALEDLDLDAIAALIWLERAQRERKLAFLDVYQDLQQSDETDFEITDVIIKGRSLMGNEDTEAEEDADPTAGS